MGVRSNTEELDRVLRRLLSDHVVTDVEAPPNYAARVEPPGDGARALHTFYRSHSRVLSTPRPARLGTALLAHLAAHLPRPADTLWLGLAAVTDGRAAAVLMVGSPRDRATLEPHLRRSGLQLLDEPALTIDPSEPAILLGADLSVDVGALDELDELADAPPSDPLPPITGRLPLAGWLVRSDGDGDLPSRAATAARVLARAHNARDLGGRAAVDHVGRLLSHSPLVGTTEHPRRIADAAARLLAPSADLKPAPS